MPPEANQKSLNDVARGPGRLRKVPKALEFIRHKFASILIEDAYHDFYDNIDEPAIVENASESIISQSTIDSVSLIENLLVNHTNSNESQTVYTQLTETQTQIRYNMDGSIAKKRGRKPKNK